MRKPLLILLSTCFFTFTLFAQKFDPRNYRATSMGAVATRANLFKVDSTGAVLPGHTSSTGVQKGLELFLEFQFESCIEYISRQLDRQERKELFELRGLCYQYLFEYEKAIEDYQQALAIHPDDTTFEAIVHNYYEMEKYTEALHWAEKGIEKHPASVVLWHALAKVTQRAAPDWHESLPVYRKAAEIDGTSRFYNMAGGVCWSYGDYDCAVEHLNMAIALAPGNAYYYSRRGSFYAEGGLYEKAIRDQLKAVELAPENGGYWHSLAEAYYFQGDKKRKKEALIRSVAPGYGECFCIIHGDE